MAVFGQVRFIHIIIILIRSPVLIRIKHTHIVLMVKKNWIEGVAYRFAQFANRLYCLYW